MTIIWLLVGLGLIVLGADWLVEGASTIAQKAGVSEFVIGLTIVGFGTSCPELVVSLTGALEGNADVAIAYAQLFDFSNYTYEPATEFVELRGPRAEQLIYKI